MESELWNLTVKNNDLASYTQIFQELTMMCTKMVPKEEDRVEKFIGGVPDNIQGNVIVAEPTRLQDAIRIANNLMVQKLKGYGVKNAKNKRRLEVNQRYNRGHQPPFKRPNVRGQNVARAYTAGNNESKSYNGPLPLCNKCKLHHEWPCTVRCGKCNKVGHWKRIFTKGQKTKPKTTKLGTEWKRVRLRESMPPKRTFATARVAATARAASAPMTAAFVGQLIEARVSEELANHETL
ncbi:hypothetical protein Tco_0904881 [Tanacetum coccineum]